MKKILLILSLLLSFNLISQTSTTPNTIILGQSGDNGSFSSGWTDFSVSILNDVQIIFTSTQTSGESGFDYLMYRIDDNPAIYLNLNQYDTVNLVSGQNFSFRFYTVDNIVGAGFYKISQFSPGFTDQFDPTNWTLSHNNSDGTAEFAEEQPIEICSSTPKRNNFEWINSVTLVEFSNISGKNEGGYGNYTESEPMFIENTNSINIILDPGYKKRQYTEYWRVWIDLNNDGDYSDDGEMVLEVKGKGALNETLNITQGISSSEMKMKVAMSWKQYPPYCGSFTNGEVEEYKIRILQEG